MNPEIIKIIYMIVIPLFFAGMIAFGVYKIFKGGKGSFKGFAISRPASKPVNNNLTKDQVEAQIAKLDRKKPIALIADCEDGLVLENIDTTGLDDEDIGRLRRFCNYDVYFIKRAKDGLVTPIAPLDKPGEVSPEDAATALEDPDSGAYFNPSTSFMDTLNDWKLPLICGLELLTIFIIAIAMP